MSIDIIGLQSGYIMGVTPKQLEYLIKTKLVFKVPKYQGVELGEFCYMDSMEQSVKSEALTQLLDDFHFEDDLQDEDEI